MWLRKETGGTAIGPYEWPEDGSVTEVPDELGRSLLAIPESGFEKVGEPSREITEGGESSDDGEQDADGKEASDAGNGTEGGGEPPPGGKDAGSTPDPKRRTRKTAVQE